jgi:hypothetical protein
MSYANWGSSVPPAPDVPAELPSRRRGTCWPDGASHDRHQARPRDKSRRQSFFAWVPPAGPAIRAHRRAKSYRWPAPAAGMTPLWEESLEAHHGRLRRDDQACGVPGPALAGLHPVRGCREPDRASVLSRRRRALAVSAGMRTSRTPEFERFDCRYPTLSLITFGSTSDSARIAQARPYKGGHGVPVGTRVVRAGVIGPLLLRNASRFSGW